MGVSPLAMMSMHEQYPWMKEKKSVRKGQIPGISRKNSSGTNSQVYVEKTAVGKIPGICRNNSSGTKPGY